jgi:ribosomal protein S18 acetylase RimI-like enzyme
VEVRRTQAADWQELRELRLRALADAPDAFSGTLEQAVALPQEVWRQWAEGGPASADFLAHEGGVAVGMVGVFGEPNAPGRMQLVAMWVDPRHRRRGIARALADQVVRWASERQAREVILWVTDTNTAARMLYERVGFRPTGEREPLPSNPALTQSLLRLSLEGSSARLKGPAP